MEYPHVQTQCPKREMSIPPSELLTADEAERVRLEKKDLMSNVFTQIGSEHYGEIVMLLKKKCFADLKDEDASRHVMHRIMTGTMINHAQEGNVQFVYDAHDHACENLLVYLAGVDTIENAEKIITQIDVESLENGYAC